VYPTPTLLKVPEALEALQCSKQTLYRMINDGRLRTVHLGRATRIPRSEIDRFVAEQLAVVD
jgi:excisionase family DNA binding protein